MHCGVMPDRDGWYSTVHLDGNQSEAAGRGRCRICNTPCCSPSTQKNTVSQTARNCMWRSHTMRCALTGLRAAAATGRGAAAAGLRRDPQSELLLPLLPLLSERMLLVLVLGLAAGSLGGLSPSAASVQTAGICSRQNMKRTSETGARHVKQTAGMMR